LEIASDGLKALGIGGRGADGKEIRKLTPDAEIAVREWKNRNVNTVDEVREWARTSRGGRQQNMFAPEAVDVPSCMSTWGVCE
jgi:hypothetical protein